LQWLCTDERVANPQNQYGISKIAEESVALNLGRRYEIPSVAMRYSIVQGPRQSFYNAYSGACRVFCLAFASGQVPPIFEDGRQVRDFVNIHDVVDANMLCLADPRADYQMFNVGGDAPVTVAEFSRVVADVYGHRDYEPQLSGRYRFGDTRHICSSVDKLKALGWRPRRTMHDSVAAYRAWLDTADSIADILDAARRQMEAQGVVRTVR
jgi:dTDP-L-rhamnose 4-epimerase